MGTLKDLETQFSHHTQYIGKNTKKNDDNFCQTTCTAQTKPTHHPEQTQKKKILSKLLYNHVLTHLRQTT